MIYPLTDITRLEKVLNAIGLNLLRAKQDILAMKQRAHAGKDELALLVNRADKLIKKTKYNVDATELIRGMRDRDYDI